VGGVEVLRLGWPGLKYSALGGRGGGTPLGVAGVEVLRNP
jgi:hypothetical protein